MFRFSPRIRSDFHYRFKRKLNTLMILQKKIAGCPLAQIMEKIEIDDGILDNKVLLTALLYILFHLNENEQCDEFDFAVSLKLPFIFVSLFAPSFSQRNHRAQSERQLITHQVFESQNVFSVTFMYALVRPIS